MSSEELQQAHEAAWRLLDALEEMLASGQPFACGSAFSVADAFTVPMLARLHWRGHGQQIWCDTHATEKRRLSALSLSLLPGYRGSTRMSRQSKAVQIKHASLLGCTHMRQGSTCSGRSRSSISAL